LPPLPVDIRSAPTATVSAAAPAAPTPHPRRLARTARTSSQPGRSLEPDTGNTSRSRRDAHPGGGKAAAAGGGSSGRGGDVRARTLTTFALCPVARRARGAHARGGGRG
jgi:hypothetical protein